MLNTYAVMMGQATVDEILDSGLGVFTHIPDEEIDLELVELMVLYFQDVEMYEYCSELLKYKDDNWHPDGTKKNKYCECELPSISKYIKDLCCNKCKKPLK